MKLEKIHKNKMSKKTEKIIYFKYISLNLM